MIGFDFQGLEPEVAFARGYRRGHHPLKKRLRLGFVVA
jgi:hypothetical protein